MSSDIAFFKSKSLKHFKPLLDGLLNDFGYDFWHYVLIWCNEVDGDPKDFGKYWEVWLIEVQKKVVGVCGLYSNLHHDDSELWLGWLGILPQYRHMGFGGVAIDFMQMQGSKIGCKKLRAYIYPDYNDPLPYYEKKGFKLINTPQNSEYEGYFLIEKEIDLKHFQNLL